MLVCVIINIHIITIIYDTFVDYDGSVKREVVADIEIGLNGSKFVFRKGESVNTLWECERTNWYINKDIFLYPIMSPLADELFIAVFMARRAIPMIAFHGVESIYIYIFSCVHLREYVLYT